MGSFRQTFAGIDAALINLVGDDGVLDAVPLKGLFAAPWRQPEVGQMRTEIIEPEFWVVDAVDLSAVVEGTSVLTVFGDDYTVLDVQPDGDGMTRLPLRPNS
nr:hypothetical protein 9 [Gammaproteobacteria bacterium]